MFFMQYYYIYCMITSIDKVLLNSIVIYDLKTHSKLGTDGIFLNFIKDICESAWQIPE